MHLRGCVLDAQGAPVPSAVVKIWQCNAFGHYHRPRDRADGCGPGFQGPERVPAGPEGGYAFRTIRSVPYPERTPPIHVVVIAPGRAPLVIQFYVAGEPLNEREGLFNVLHHPRQREAVLPNGSEPVRCLLAATLCSANREGQGRAGRGGVSRNRRLGCQF
jgi:protocatechuate 3,4-dioxygenase beta subunit